MRRKHREREREREREIKEISRVCPLLNSVCVCVCVCVDAMGREGEEESGKERRAQWKHSTAQWVEPVYKCVCVCVYVCVCVCLCVCMCVC